MTKEDFQQAMEMLGKANIHIAGDFVMEKRVGTEIGKIHVEPGGVGIQISNDNNVSVKKEEVVNNSSVPEVLSTQKAMMFWDKLQKAGLVDNDNKPLVSRPQAALIAYEMSERLEIPYKWKCFEDFWQRKNMRNDYNNALEQVQSLKFQDLLKKIFAE